MLQKLASLAVKLARFMAGGTGYEAYVKRTERPYTKV